ncbi:uncharacterized protein LOC142629237 [Castanea sativa]|uniref:uncharacterized protein LOC142629237 n=1 Tax=Castanea sativa TaxID=21020 RepID=UPI003F64F9C1
MIGRDDFHENTINYENVDNVRHNVMDDHDDDSIEFQDDIGDGIDHTSKIKDLQNLMKERFNHNILYYKIWDAKQKAIANIHGNWEELFAHCRPVVSIDRTHLYGKYRGKLLTAMATDANNEIFSLAFAVVDDETGASWGWFLSCPRTAIQDVVPDSGICIISNRHRAKYEHQDRKLEKILDCLKLAELKFSKDLNPNIAKKKPYSYLMKEGLEQWTLSHDGGHRYGAMTTNMSECFNRVLKGARGLPISALVDYIWCKLVAYFNDRRTKILGDIEHGQEFSKHAMEKYEANYKKGTKLYVRPFNQQNGVYQVCTTHNPHKSDGGDHSHEVRLLENTCTYGKWEIYKISCSHVIAICIREHVDAMMYIDPCYTLQQRLATYSHEFCVSKDKSLWWKVAGPKLYSDPEMLREKGRPMSTRIRNEMD